MKPQPDAYVFNEGKSRTILHYADINQAYIVYREDGIHTDSPMQGNVRVHNQYSDAKADYDGRVVAIEHMNIFINRVEQEAEELFGSDEM